jgi:hypothetical protein
MFLKRIGELRPSAVVYSVLALVFLLVPAVGSVYPVPAPPVNTFPYIFGAYFLIGLIIFLLRRNAAKVPDLRPELAPAEEPATALAS